MELKSEQYRIIYDKPSATVCGVDNLRKYAFVIPNNVKGFAMINLKNGWNMYANVDSRHGIILGQPMENPEFLLSDNATLRHAAIQAMSQATTIAVSQIPSDKSVIYMYQNYVDIEFFIKAVQSENIATYLQNNFPNLQQLKMKTYINILNNTDDIFTAIRQMRTKTGRIIDLPRAFYNRLPDTFGFALAHLFGILTGTTAGYLDSIQLQTQIFTLLQLIPGANNIQFIDTSGDRTWTIQTTNSNTYYITSTGLVYNATGSLIDTVDTSQTGTVIGLPLYDKAHLNTTFPSTSSNNNNNWGIFGPFQMFFNMFGNAFGMNSS